jgi:hypothetical protein
MKLWTLIGRSGILLLALSISASRPVLAQDDTPSSAACGTEQLACGESEHCCEHTVAMFSDAGASAPPYKEGKCIPKEQKCEAFWCGNRHCQASFFGTPTICCVSAQPELPPEYKCAYSELNCPGNNQQLTIRDHTQNPG